MCTFNLIEIYFWEITLKIFCDKTKTLRKFKSKKLLVALKNEMSNDLKKLFGESFDESPQLNISNTYYWLFYFINKI